ncbi:MAG TPA: ABC transporter ATP-binding protein [Verrucomicrobiae bacterium]|jgi:phospholipid/cholesterol/gamma-HCH transport system ATP-binding protein|nr:ABC transporter ATP-binding protein [Verrucomicrobiae bacterium]
MIEVREIRKSFGSQQVLDGISFCIEPGDSVVIIGRSGCGKSVLLKHLIALMRPDSGRVIIDDEDITNFDERRLLQVRQKFGMLFQSAALFDSLNVAENISFVLRREGKLSQKEIDERVEDVLEMVELPGTQQKKPSELSGGMRKRVGLARAIIYKPEIVLYDEPTTGLDPVVSDSIDQLIIRVRERLKITTVVVTHDTRSMRRVGQRILMMVNGKIYAAGPPEDIFASQDPVIHRFVNGISDPRELTF